MLYKVGLLEMVNISKNNLEVVVMDEMVVNLVSINMNIVEVVLNNEKVLIILGKWKQELRSKVIGLVVVNILGLSRGQH